MPKFKMQDPDLWVRKRIERIDNQELPPVGVFSSPPDCEYQNNFISAEHLDVKKLIKDLSSSSHFKRNKFDVDVYKNSISSRFKNYKEEDAKKREIVKSTIRPTQQKVISEPNQVTSDQLDRGIEALNYLSLASDLLVNTTKCYLNNNEENNHFEIDIDIANKSISYTYYIYFEDTAENDGKAAIILKTGGADLLLFFLEKVYGKNKARKVRSAIWKAFIYKLYDQNSIGSLAFLYDKLPNFMRSGYHTDAEKEKKPYKISDELLWKHFKMFAAYDDGIYDSSYYVIYIMTLITPLFCMQRFMEDQKLVLDVYENLDDQGIIDDFFGWYDLSKTFRGSTSFEPTNRDVFVTLLNSYVQMFEGNADICVFESSGAHFHQGRHNVRPNAVEAFQHTISYGITASIEDDTIHLENYWRSTENRGYTIIPENRFKKSRTVIDEVISDGYTDGYYNPLDTIKFTQYNERGEAITMNAPAIFVRHVSYIKKWERIGKVMRLGFNLLMIIGSAATIYSGASSMMLYAAITDMGLAAGDIFVQEKLARGDYGTKEGREFLALWDKIYNTAGFLTFTPVAVKLVVTNTPKIIGFGADLLQVTGKRIYKDKALKKVTEFTQRAIRSVEIPNFNKTGLRIVLPGQKIAGLTNISKLQRVGVVFCLNIYNDIIVIYKSVPIAIGKAEEVLLQLRSVLKLQKEKLISYLQDLADVCRLVFKNKKFLDVIRYVISNRVFKELLSIYEEAIIIYYTTSAYEKLNKALRGIIELKKEYISFERLLNKALDKLPNSEYNGLEHILYRSVEMSDELIEKLFLGKTEYFEEGFFSTSYNYKKFLDWFEYQPSHNVIFKIYGKNGKLIEAISDIPNEAEVLFKSKTKFEILSAEPAPHPFDPNLEVYEIILIEK